MKLTIWVYTSSIRVFSICITFLNIESRIFVSDRRYICIVFFKRHQLHFRGPINKFITTVHSCSHDSPDAELQTNKIKAGDKLVLQDQMKMCIFFPPTAPPRTSLRHVLSSNWILILPISDVNYTILNSEPRSLAFYKDVNLKNRN